jgi:hypothetical protein
MLSVCVSALVLALLGKRVRPGDDADGEDDEPSSKEHRSDQQLSVRQEERALALSTMQSPLSREPEKANPHTFSLSSALYANDQGFTMTGSRVPFERTREGGGAGGQLGGRNGDCSKDMEVPQEQGEGKRKHCTTHAHVLLR